MVVIRARWPAAVDRELKFKVEVARTRHCGKARRAGRCQQQDMGGNVWNESDDGRLNTAGMDRDLAGGAVMSVGGTRP